MNICIYIKFYHNLYSFFSSFFLRNKYNEEKNFFLLFIYYFSRGKDVNLGCYIIKV